MANYQRCFPGFDDKIVSMYGCDMSACEIVGHLRELYFLVLNRSKKQWKSGPREWGMAKSPCVVISGDRFTRAVAAWCSTRRPHTKILIVQSRRNWFQAQDSCSHPEDDGGPDTDG